MREAKSPIQPSPSTDGHPILISCEIIEPVGLHTHARTALGTWSGHSFEINTPAATPVPSPLTKLPICPKIPLGSASRRNPTSSS